MAASRAAIAGLGRRAAAIAACALVAGAVIATPATAEARSVGQPQEKMSCVAVGRYVSCASWRTVRAALPPEASSAAAR
jgi:hypothetical protein